MAQCKDDLEDVEVPVEEGEALAAKSGGRGRPRGRPYWIKGCLKWISLEMLTLKMLLDQYEIQKFKGPGFGGRRSSEDDLQLASLQCIEAGCIAFPRSSQKLGRNKTFASEGLHNRTMLTRLATMSALDKSENRTHYPENHSSFQSFGHVQVFRVKFFLSLRCFFFISSFLLFGCVGGVMFFR